MVVHYQGSTVTEGMFGAWAALGAEVVAGGYEVAWKNGGADAYTIWNVDSGGNYVSQSSFVSGASLALQTSETAFHQDLNGDGTIGPTGGAASAHDGWHL